VEEQSVLRRETISAFHGAVDGAGSDDEEEDDLLVPREKARDELDHEEEEYREFLEREVGQDLRELVTLDAPPAAATEGAAEEAEEDGEKKKKRKKDKKKKGEAPRASKEDDDQEFLIKSVSSHHNGSYEAEAVFLCSATL
jgi:protein KRI1